ncbi:MAG: glycosyltransferase family 4 protein, partial [Bacteroidota bacterium]
FTLPDKTGWQVNPTLMIWQQRQWLDEQLLRGGFDAVLVHYLHAAAPLARIAARTADIPLWIDVNEGMSSVLAEGQQGLHRWLLKQLSAADVVIAQCSVQKADLQSALPGKQIRVIPLAIEDAAPAAIPPDAPPLQCICVSRLDLRSKCVDRLLRAVAAVRSVDGTDLRLTITGDGYLRNELQQLAGELGIAEAVRFVGWQSPEELREMLRSQHFAVQPSEHESFGLAALEAAAAGLPLVAGTRAGVVPDLVSAGAALRTFHSSSPAELAQAIRDIRDRWPELQRQAIEARGRIHERYSWRAHTSLYAALFRSLGK